MTCTESIRRQLEQGLGGGCRDIQISMGDLQVHLRLADWDRLGCLLERLEIRHRGGRPLHLTPVSIEKRVTYLEEALRVIEIEEARGHALLRSAPPTVSDGKVMFFEIILDRSKGLSLARYAYDRERGKRDRIAAPLTRHALVRLVDDLLALNSET